MKKYLFSALAMGLILTSCQSDEPFALGEGGEKQVTFTINVPGDLGTRAATGNKSEAGGLSNNLGVTRYYTLVLDANGDTQILKVSNTGTTATFTPTVVLGRNYTITAYASLENNASIDEIADIEAIEVSKNFNDETKDAYFKTVTHNFADGELNTLELRRPFGKLRLLATDYNVTDNTKPITDVKSVTVEYTSEIQNKFNAVDGIFNNQVTVASSTYNWTENGSNYENYYSMTTDGAMPLFADYIPANDGDNPTSFKVTVTYGNNETYSRTFNDIPVKRNALTTLRGNFFTVNSEITVEVKEEFDGGESVKYYSGVTIGGTNYDSLEEAIAEAQSGDVLRLDGDIVLVYNATRANENFLMEINKNVTIDLNGKNINATVGDVTVNSGIFHVINGGELTIEGEGNVNITTGKAPNALTTFINNDGGIVNLKGGNWTLKSLEFPDALIPCFVDNNSNVASATLNISGGTYTFHRNLFRNFANAASHNEYKTVAEINISGGTFNGKTDDAGDIWNQKPSTNTPDGAGVINVTGGVFNNVVINDDFGKVSNAENQAQLDSNVATAKATIQLEAGKYKFPSTFAEGVTLVCEEGVVFEGTSGLNIKGSTVIGARFSNPDGIAGTGTIHGTYKDCTFEGSEVLRWCYSEVGKTVNFEDCVFKTDFRGVHFDDMKGDVTFRNCKINGFNAIGGNGKVTFVGCTFGNDESSYNGLNMYADIDIKDCKFNYVSGNTNFIDFEGTGKTMTITNSIATLDGESADITDFIGGSKISQNTAIVNNKYYVTNNEGLKKAIDAGATTVLLADADADDYDLNGIQKDGLTLIGLGEKVEIKNTTKYASGNATGAIWKAINLKNVTITNTVYTMADGGQATFEDVVFGAGFRQGYGKGVKFDNCVFGSNTEGYALHFQTDNASEGGVITLSGCAFNGGKVHLGGKRSYNFSGCDFAEGTDFQVWSNIELNNCTVNGVKVTSENVATLFPNLDLTKVTIK